MSESEVIKEYYFDDYYRVLVIESGSKYVISVDVYYADWKYGNYREVCIGEVCLLVKELAPSEINVNFANVEKVMVIGVRVGDKRETVNVKWIMGSKPGDDEIEGIYRHSWRIAQGELTEMASNIRE